MATARLVASAAAAVVVVRMLVHPAAPEPGYHPHGDAADVVGAGVIFGFAAAAAIVTVRTLGEVLLDSFKMRQPRL